MRLFGVRYLRTLKVIAMLLPDSIHPKHSLYYNGAIVLQILEKDGSKSISDLFVEVRQMYGMSFRLLLLSLDWLYLINAAVLNEKGEVCLCS